MKGKPMSTLKSVILALSMSLVAPAVVHASEITLVPAVKLQKLAIATITVTTGTAVIGATTNGGAVITTGAITTGAHMMNIAMIIMMTTIVAAARIVTGAITKSSVPVAARAAGKGISVRDV